MQLTNSLKTKPTTYTSLQKPFQTPSFQLMPLSWSQILQSPVGFQVYDDYDTPRNQSMILYTVGETSNI